MKYVALATLLFVLGIGALWIDRSPNEFTPVVRVRTDNGLFMTLIQSSSDKRNRCLDAVDALVHELGKACPTCYVESTDCPTLLQGTELALAHKEPMPLYVVSSDAMRIGILGPPASVRERCEQMASVMARGGVKSACIPPGGAS